MNRILRYLSWIITIPLAAIVISFAISNRDPAILRLWPLPQEVEAPLFLPVLGALVVGFVWGAVIAWWSGRRHRRLSRRQGNRLRSLSTEVKTLKSQEAKSAERATRERESERLAAAARASETSAQLERGDASKRLTPAGTR